MVQVKVTTGGLQRNGVFALPLLKLYPHNQPSIISKRDESWWTRPRKYAFVAIYGTLNTRINKPTQQPRCLRVFFFDQLSKFYPDTQDFGGTGLPYLAHFLLGEELYQLSKKTKLEYDESILCPILAGDTSWTLRFFDVMLKGCIPVVVEFHLKKPGFNDKVLQGEETKSWWRPDEIIPCPGHERVEEDVYHISNIVETYPFIPSLSTYNNTIDQSSLEWSVDYRSFVVVAPAVEGDESDLTPMLEAMKKVLNDPEDIRRRQLNMKKYILRFTLGLGLDAHKYGDSFDSLLKLLELYKDGLKSE